ncbi:uncharacterized protein LOC117899298 [Drosophila subobscura]|uniref:uncharacterized protein LOC117899298 n=1 Tax=Drosophila subobscura TaxID=7241 RepID=UPI00155A8BB1|nr:uncharacterized protein LOC117899298 [Drosophila subobscura]
MEAKLTLLVQLMVILCSAWEITSKFEFTNVNCTSLDENFTEIEYCYLKSINRTYKYFSARVTLFQVPVTNIKVNLALLKRLNGYKPFLYNYTVDACRFLKNPKSKPVINYFYEFFRPWSNMNHSCPFNHDLVVDKLTASFINHQFTNILAFPEGDYLLETNWFAYGIKRAVVKVYGTLRE